MGPDVVVGRGVGAGKSAASAVLGWVREHDHVHVSVVIAGVRNQVRPVVVELPEVDLIVDARQRLPKSRLHPTDGVGAEYSVAIRGAKRITAAGAGDAGVGGLGAV